MTYKHGLSDKLVNEAGKANLVQKDQRQKVENMSGRIGKGLNDLASINDNNLSELEALLAQSEMMLQGKGISTDLIDYESIDTSSMDAALAFSEDDWNSIKTYNFGKIDTVDLNDDAAWSKYLENIEDYAERNAVDLSVDFFKELLTQEDYNEVAELHKQFDKTYSDRFLNEQRDYLLHIIIDRFGIGGILARQDKTGGNVDTIHNAREGIYATEEEQQRFANRPEYDSALYHSDKRYTEKNKHGKTQKQSGNLKDEYTGNTIAPNQNYDLDHIKSAKTIHDDAGRILAERDGVELANREENFAFTDRSVNRSKKQKSAGEFANELDNKRYSRQDRINELSQKKALTDTEKNELNKLQKLNSVDTGELRKRGDKAEKEYEKEVNKYYCSPKFISNLGKQSVLQGTKMGIRAIVGIFLTEAISSVFDEIRDFCRNLKSMSKKWYEDLKERIQRILARLSAKWKEALQSGLTGFISGFCSNIATVIINIFVTTAKNIVRIIREGFLSIVKAVKMLMHPPKGMSTKQLYHEVGKLIIAGIIVVLGVLAEETIDNLPPMVAIRNIPIIGEILADVIWGLLVGIATCIALWAWDKIDFFGVKDEARDKYIYSAFDRENKINV